MYAPFNALKHFVARLRQILTPKRQRQSRPLVRQSRLGVEMLEGRELMSANSRASC